jgi:chromosome segregation ATPase
MNAGKTLQYLDDQREAIQALIEQLDEIQVAFNAQFDQFKARHDAALDRLTDQIADQRGSVGAQLRATFERRIPQERERIEERRQKVRTDYLPKRQRAADDLLQQAQSELAELRALNPELDKQEEELKRDKAELESRLKNLNQEIQQKSRRLGVVRHLMAITNADRERQRILGRLDMINKSLHDVRREWETKQKGTLASQAKLQEQWQLESIAVARLQAELDQLDDEALREDLAQRRAIRHVLDELKEPSPGTEPQLEEGLREMVQLNIRTDGYHEGLATVGGFIGLLRGINNGIEAVHKSVSGLLAEQEMHSDYLKPLDFSLPARVQAFHQQWPALGRQFSDEQAIGAHPAEFSRSVKPIVEGSLSQASIEEMFDDLGKMIKQATAAW